MAVHKNSTFPEREGKLLSVAVGKSGQLLSVAACACEHKMHFPLFPYLAAHFYASRA